MAGEPGDSMGLVYDSIAVHLSADVFHMFSVGEGGDTPLSVQPWGFPCVLAQPVFFWE